MITKCKACDADLLYKSDYCPSCGTILIETQKCSHHQDEDAEAVCVICQKSFCSECGSDVNGRFFCGTHISVGITLSSRRNIASYSTSEINVVAETGKPGGLFLSDQ